MFLHAYYQDITLYLLPPVPFIFILSHLPALKVHLKTGFHWKHITWRNKISNSEISLCLLFSNQHSTLPSPKHLQNLLNVLVLTTMHIYLFSIPMCRVHHLTQGAASFSKNWVLCSPQFKQHIYYLLRMYLFSFLFLTVCMIYLFLLLLSI